AKLDSPGHEGNQSSGSLPNINSDGVHWAQRGGHKVEFPAARNLRNLNLTSEFLAGN
ncbi:hypothetical protein QR685DRAFT_434646, partial [Neurospora intermedia]